ncbi:MAG: hypothetical protein R2712_02320 [Vicinamibacterales bacterium]
MAGLVPGVVTGRMDVGGTEGMQQYNLEAFGSADSQKSFSIDGLKTNWPGGSGGATMQYYGFEMYEEYNMQTASGTAESDVSGVYMNMVTKSGGNRITSDHNFYFMNDALQGDNIDDALRQRLGIGAGAETGAAGNPIDISYDWSSTLGGPIKRDRAWFFGAMRWWRLDQFQVGARNSDGSQAIDDNRIRNFVGKATWQTTPAVRTSVMFNRNLKDRFHRRDSPYLFVEDKATVLQDQPAQNLVAQYNHIVGQRMVVDARVGSMWGTFPSRYQDEVSASDIAIRDVQTFQRFNAAEIQSLNPNYRVQANGTVSYFVPSLAGSHDFKGGLQLSWEKMEYERIRNGDILLEMRDGVPFQGQIANTPINPITGSKPGARSSRTAGRWDGPRSTSVCAWTACRDTRWRSRARRAPTSASARSTRRTSSTSRSTSCRGLASPYDLRGNGQTAIKAHRPLLQPVRIGAARDVEPQRPDHAQRGLDRPQRQPAAGCRRAGRDPHLQRRAVPDVRHGRQPALQRRVQRGRGAPARTEPGRGRELSPQAAPRRPGRGRSGPADQRLYAGGADVHQRRRLAGHDHRLQAAAGVRRAARPRDHQRRRAAERLRRRAVRHPEADVEPLAAAGGAVAAEPQGLRPQRHA